MSDDLPPPAPTPDPSWPRRIMPVDPAAQRSHSVVLREIVNAVREYPPHFDRLFCQGGKLVELDGSLPRTVDDGRLAFFIDAAALIEIPGGRNAPPKWFRPPREDRAVILANAPEFFPELLRICDTPFYGPQGAVTRPGYHAASKTFVAWRGTLPEVDDATVTDVLQRLLDFPFRSQADAVTALGLMILPLVRPLIHGPTPLHLITAPLPRSGKSYLGELAGIIAHGELPQAASLDGWSPEAGRQLATYLADLTSPFLFLDNLTSGMTLGGAELHRYLSSAAQKVKIRLTGAGRTSLVSTDCTWIATGNQIDVDSELAGRAVVSHIDHVQKVRKTPNLHAWALKNRDTILAVLMKLVVEWVDAGKPKPSRTLPSFERWAHVVGGILTVAGWGDEFLHPRYRPVAADQRDWLTLLTHWSPDLDGALSWLSAKEVLVLADHHSLQIVQGHGRSAETSMGKALTKFHESGLCLGGYTLAVRTERNGKRYCPVASDDSVTSAVPAVQHAPRFRIDSGASD